jgi:hydrogenase maturation factor
LILTKRLATEAVAIIAAEKHSQLQPYYSPKELARLQNFLHNPGISVVPEAMLCAALEGVHAMHDPTEGGVATGLHEMAGSAKLGLEIFEEALPYYPECLQLCQHFQLNPLGLIASGSLLIAVDPHHTATLLEELHRHHIEAQRIGRIQPLEFGRQLINAQGESRPLPTFERDEITRLFEQTG